MPVRPPVFSQRVSSPITIARSADEEIRVNWAEYEGKPYVSVRLWNRDRDNGTWWPDAKKGMSIRLRELADFAEAIAEALDLAGEHQGRRQPDGTPRRGPPRPSASGPRERRGV